MRYNESFKAKTPTLNDNEIKAMIKKYPPDF